jgi:hypothetical protein
LPTWRGRETTLSNFSYGVWPACRDSVGPCQGEPAWSGPRRRGGAAYRMTDGRPLTAAEPSLPGRKVIALDVDAPAFVERNLQ